MWMAGPSPGPSPATTLEMLQSVCQPLVLRHLQLEEPRRVKPEYLRPLPLVQLRHGALDGFRRMRPGALVVWIIAGPHEVIHQPPRLGQRQARRILLERGK